MKYLITQLSILLISVIFMYYFSTLPEFTPYLFGGGYDWYKIGTVIFFIFLFLESIISLIVFLVEKFTLCGRKEFPNSRRSIKWGIGLSLCVISLLFLHLNHLVTLGWGLVIIVCFAIIIIVL